MKTGMVTLLSVTLAAVCAARGESVREVLGKCAGSEEIPGAVSAVVPSLQVLQFSAPRFGSLMSEIWLLVAGYWRLVAGYWLLIDKNTK